MHLAEECGFCSQLYSAVLYTHLFVLQTKTWERFWPAGHLNVWDFFFFLFPSVVNDCGFSSAQVFFYSYQSSYLKHDVSLWRAQKRRWMAWVQPGAWSHIFHFSAVQQKRWTLSTRPYKSYSYRKSVCGVVCVCVGLDDLAWGLAWLPTWLWQFKLFFFF